MLPSAAGPMLPERFHRSSSVVSVPWWRMPPMEMTFFAHACGRDRWLPVLLWLCVIGMSCFRINASSSAERAPYVVTWG